MSYTDPNTQCLIKNLTKDKKKPRDWKTKLKILKHCRGMMQSVRVMQTFLLFIMIVLKVADCIK